MEHKYTVAVLIGSLRKGSYSGMTAKALAEFSPESLALEEVAIGTLPLYDQDLDTDTPPQAWAEFRKRIRACDAVLFVTPEYNRSVPAALKNAIDVGSRPYGQSAWDGKPGAVISISPGALGAFGANHHLRQSLVCLNVPTMQQPEAYVGGIANAFDAEGNLVAESTRDFFKAFMAAFAVWVEKHSLVQ
jgi:chromate reductase